MSKCKPTSTDSLIALKACLADLTNIYCGSNIDKSNFYLHCPHFNPVRSLRNNDSIVIFKPDKGSGFVKMAFGEIDPRYHKF